MAPASLELLGTDLVLYAHPYPGFFPPSPKPPTPGPQLRSSTVSRAAPPGWPSRAPTLGRPPASPSPAPWQLRGALRCADSLRLRLRCPRPARPSQAAPAGAASVCLQPRGHREPSAAARALTPECPLPAPRTATASPQSPHDAGHCRFHQDGLCVEQLEKSGYSLYFSNACLRRTGTGTRTRPLCIISPVGPLHALSPRAFCWGE